MLRFGMCGSRQWRNDQLIFRVMLLLKQKHGVYIVVYGSHWEGADRMILNSARRLELPVDPFPAEWDKYVSTNRRKNPAGQIRNRKMAYSGLAGAFAFRANGESPGTDGMMGFCHAAGVPGVVIGEKTPFEHLVALLGSPPRDSEPAALR